MCRKLSAGFQSESVRCSRRGSENCRLFLSVFDKASELRTRRFVSFKSIKFVVGIMLKKQQYRGKTNFYKSFHSPCEFPIIFITCVVI